jgi:hypothetical protein
MTSSTPRGWPRYCHRRGRTLALLLAALFLLPSLGFAQTLTLTVSGTSTTVGTATASTPTLAANASACSYSVSASWTGTSLTGACTSLQIWLTATTCGTAPSTTNSPADVVVYTAQAGSLTGGLTSDSFSFSFNTLPSFSSNSCGSVVDFTNMLCAAVTIAATGGACTGTVAQASPVNIRYDNVPPDPPTVSIVQLDSKLSVHLSPAGSGTAASDIQYFQVQYALELPDGGTGGWTAVGGNIAASTGTVTISNLVDGNNYLVVGYSIDEASNTSSKSTPVVGTPVLTYGFYANYLDDGGHPGGCGDVAGGGPSAMAFVIVLLSASARGRG